MSDPRERWLTPDWPAPPRVHAITTTCEGAGERAASPWQFNVGLRCGDDPDAVAVNREFLRDALALPSAPRWMRQVHGTVVAHFPFPARAGEGARRADGGSAAKGHPDEPETDAAVTRTPGVVLAIQTADCLPVLLCAEEGSEIAAAHAGWRGLSAGVLENTLAAMQAPREHIIAWLGPAIAAQSYEVGDEVRAAFLAQASTANSAFTATRPGHWSCDLYALARQRLRAAGVVRIFGGGYDTFTDLRLHSFRRDGAHSGRMASVIWMSRGPG